jgi:K+-sensing histidine kinase KdpD
VPTSVTKLPLRLSSGLSVRRQLVSAALAPLVLVALTAVLLSQRDDVSIATVLLLYLAAVVALSTAGGAIVGVSVAVVAFFVVNWFFTEPVHTLDVADPEQVAELVVFLAVSGIVASLVDTASRRQGVLDERTAENEELAAANDLRTALLRAVSHDLRTPLTTAKLATSSLLAEDVSLGAPQQRELVQLADREIDRLVTIVENLLDAGRLQAGALTVDLEVFHLAPLGHRVIAALPCELRTRMVNAIAPDCPDVRGDVALLERVVANLIANAAAADPDHPITLRTSELDGGVVALDVVDHGPGLPPEQRAAAFEPFQRFEDRGSTSGIGLGLSISAGFCDAMGASLHLLDTPGGGLTARVELERAA